MLVSMVFGQGFDSPQVHYIDKEGVGNGSLFLYDVGYSFI